MAMAETQEPGHRHGDVRRPELEGVLMNVEGHTQRFRNWLTDPTPEGLGIAIDWTYNCAQCCFYFLHKKRQYDLGNGRAPRVEFGVEPTTSCNVDTSRKKKEW